MFGDVDKTLQNLFQIEFGTPLPFDLSFALPDKDFHPISNSRMTLNLYLYDIREDREIRTVQPRLERNADGTVTKRLPPSRVRLAYCISAWSPAQAGAMERALDEHNLLGRVMAALLRHPTIPPEALVGAIVGQEPPPPTSVASPEDHRASRDFWNAIGGPLRPVVDFSVTAALAYQDSPVGPMATSAALRTDGGPERYLVSGVVRDASATGPRKGLPLSGAWIRHEETGRTEVTDGDGRFLFDRLAPGPFTITARAVGYGEGRRTLTVPHPDGSYDLGLTPL